MRYSIFFFAVILLFLSSCQRILDEHYDREMEANYTSPYMGRWVGNYGGGESGTLTINVAKNGRISGTFGQNSEILVSSVLDNGALLPVNSDDPLFVLYGSLIEKKGTWKKDKKQGTWTLTKQ